MTDTINQVGTGAPAAWTKTKPTAPGAYWIRGEVEGMLARTALVEVVNLEGELWCNLHMRNTDPEFGYGYTVAQLDEAFEWLGPLSPAAPVVQAGQQPVAFANFKEMEMCMHKPAAGAWEPVYAAPPAQPDAFEIARHSKRLVEQLREELAAAIAERDQLRAEIERLRKGRVPAGLYRELVALRELRNQAKAYIDGYLLDEIDDVDCCVSEDQHLSAAALSRLLQEAISAQRDAAMAAKEGK